MITERELKEVGKGPYLELLGIILAFWSFDAGNNRFWIPESEFNSVKGLKLKESINFLVRDCVLRKYRTSRHKLVAISYTSFAKNVALDGVDRECLLQRQMNQMELEQYITEVRDLGLKLKFDQTVLFKTGKLSLNKQSGQFKLNEVIGVLNPACPEYRVLRMMMEDPEHQVTHKRYFGEKLEGQEFSKRRDLTYVIRDLKHALGILPKKGSKNKDIFKNSPRHGYRLDLKV